MRAIANHKHNDSISPSEAGDVTSEERRRSDRIFGAVSMHAANMTAYRYAVDFAPMSNGRLGRSHIENT